MPESESAGQTIRSHAAGVVLYRLPESNRLEVAAMHYHKFGETTLRVFMGKQGEDEETHRSETFNETTHREFKAEALDISVPFSIEDQIKPLVYWELTQDDEDKRLHGKRPVDECELLHLKGFRAFRFIGGKLRDRIILEHEGTSKEEILNPPQWYEVRELWHKMDDFRKAAPFVHKKAVAATIHKLAQIEPGVAIRYGDIVDTTGGIIRTVPGHVPLVRKYLESLDAGLTINGKK